MFKWPDGPSPRAPAHELADFAELVCWRHKTTSVTHLAQSLGRLAENDYSEGVPEEEEIPKDIEGAFQEIERRMWACGGGYPFDVGEKGNTLHVIQDSGSNKNLVYKYLLLATRLDMSNNRTHANIDGANLLEYLAAEAARQYLGDRAQSIVFGTAEDASDFPAKINSLCDSLEEGGGFVERGGSSRRKKDDKLDVVAWKPFIDRREGKLIAFGQCKTGTNWKDHVSQLQPAAFCSKWFHSQPILTPVRMFFVSEALSSVDWRNESVDAGLIFDRCRIIDFCHEISEDVLVKITAWTEAAAQSTELPGL